MNLQEWKDGLNGSLVRKSLMRTRNHGTKLGLPSTWHQGLRLGPPPTIRKDSHHWAAVSTQLLVVAESTTKRPSIIGEVHWRRKDPVKVCPKGDRSRTGALLHREGRWTRPLGNPHDLSWVAARDTGKHRDLQLGKATTLERDNWLNQSTSKLLWQQPQEPNRQLWHRWLR
jgi:hypothetical protein